MAAMSDIFIERKPDGCYVAYQHRQVIARGNTQEEAAETAHRLSPGDPVFAERVREVASNSRESWRRVY
jgi:hypothetical protein